MNATDHRHADSPSRRPRLRCWGWGAEGEDLTPQELQAVEKAAARRADPDFQTVPPPQLDEYSLQAPAVQAPAALADALSDSPYDRLTHCCGQSFADGLRMLLREPPRPPDLVAFPRDAAGVRQVLDWATDARVAVVPYGCGSSVCGGVEAEVGGDYAGVVSLDLQHLWRVLEVDRTSRAALIQAGALGPELEAQLRPHGLTLRHFPQSFEYSTLGGWIATRSGGHYASLYTHIDDFVEALQVVTPQGEVQTRRLPGSGAGPSPDRMFIGSEGTLGVITQAWMRVQDRPRFRASASVLFAGMEAATEATRQITQAGLFPSNCRVLDPAEARANGVTGGGEAVLILGFESADHPLDAWMARALEIAADCGGLYDAEAVARSLRPPGKGAGKGEVQSQSQGDGGGEHRQGAAGAWRNAFVRMPYMRNHSMRMGLVADTFETSITWDRFAGFYQEVRERMNAVLREITGEADLEVSCRFTHVYPDGPAPYFSYLLPGGKSLHDSLARWKQVKQASNQVVVECGGTVTHHHAVGRDHRPGYQRQIPGPVLDALRAAKQSLDPAGVLNPGVLFDPQGVKGLRSHGVLGD